MVLNLCVRGKNCSNCAESVSVQNLVAVVLRHAEFVHLWCALFSDLTTECMCSWKKKNCVFVDR